MRDILVATVFFAGLFFALRRPYAAALLWVWVGLMNPHRLGWGFAYSFPFAMIAACVLAVSMVLNRDKVRLPGGSAIVLLLLFVVWMGITSSAAIVLNESVKRYLEVLKVLLMIFAVASVVRTREEILGLVLVSAGSIAFFGVKGGIFTILTGGSHRVWGPPGSVIEGNNELAVALIVIVPLLYYLVTQAASLKQLPFVKAFPEKWMRRGLYLGMILCMIAALGSHSRGALLAIAAMSGVFWWRSKSKVAMGMVILMVAAFALMFMPEGWMERMHTIENYQEDASAMGRINAWTMAVNVANDRLLGAGFETATPVVYQRYAPNPNLLLVAHSMYFSVLGEHGYIGLLIYLGFWFATYRTAGRICRTTTGVEELHWAYLLGSMAKTSLIGLAVGGAFLSLAYWDMPYYIMVMLVCTERLARETLKENGWKKPSPGGMRPTALPGGGGTLFPETRSLKGKAHHAG